jgi:hypothetical protein
MYICWGLAWHPATGEIWYSAAPSQTDEARSISVFAVGRNKKSRDVFSSLGASILRDIGADGSVLLESVALRRHITGHVHGAEGERDLSWFDWSFPMRMSADGKTLLLEEQGAASRGKYTAYLRATEGGPALRLEEVRGRDISADDEYVLALSNNPPEKLLLIPTGAGEMREVDVRGIDHFQTARFIPGQRDMLVIASREGEGSRLWRVPANGGEPIALSDPYIEAPFFHALSPDGRQIAAVAGAQKTMIFSLETHGAGKAVEGIEDDELPVHWPRADELYVCRREGHQTHIYAIDLTNGSRRLERTLRPADIAGVQGIFPVHYATKNDSYVFGYRLMLSSLFIATGLR